MKTIIAGSRGIIDVPLVYRCINKSLEYFEISEVVCGTAKGVDTLGRNWAIENKVPYIDFVPDTKKYGSPRAFFKRNYDMGDYATQLIVIWNGYSTGSMHMLEYIKALKKDYILFNIKDKKIEKDVRNATQRLSFL